MDCSEKSALQRIESWPEFAGIYFSLACLTTQGFGDVVAQSAAARLASAMEGVLGTIYIAVLISFLVAELRAPTKSG